MKNIKLKEMHIENFKGFKEFEIKFGQVTKISSDNGLGKTTVFDAFKWCLFGKDSNNNAKFSIRPIDKATGKPIDRIDITVEIILDVDGVEKVFRKTQKQNWVKKRKSENPSFEGNINEYVVDGFPTTESDYKKAINSIIDESLFIFITDPSFFPNMKWKDQRNILMEMIDEISDLSIIEQEDKFSALKEMLEKGNIDSWFNKYGKAVKEHKKEVAEIPSRIDELAKTIGELDIESAQEKINALKTKLKDIEDSIEDNSKVSDEFIGISDEITDVRKKISDLKLSLSDEHNKDLYVLKEDKALLDNELAEIVSNIKRYEDGINTLNKTIERENKELEELKKMFKEVDSEELLNDSIICPTCKQSLPEEKIKEIETNFIDNKRNRLNEINVKGKSLKKSMEFNTNEAIKLKDKLSEAISSKEKVAENIKVFEEKINNYPVLDIEANDEYKQLTLLLENTKQKLDLLKSEDKEETISKLKQEKNDIQTQIDEINKIFTEKEIMDKNKKRIEELESQQRELSQKVADCEKMIFLLEEFTIKKSTMLSEKINEKFELVKWKLFNTRINGGVEETCELTLNGVPYSDVNTAGKIQAGLDIINTLSQKHNITAPIFIDNRESVNVIPKTNAQTISLIVTSDREIKTEVA